MALSDYIGKPILEDTNTSANVAGAVGAFTGAHYAKQSLEISKRLYIMFKDTHEREEIRDKNRDEIFMQILSEIKILNNNLEKLGGIK